MPLIRNGALSADTWLSLADDAPVPAEGAVVVSVERWQTDRTVLLGRKAPLGIRLRSDQPPALIADDVQELALIALEFPKFTDGRAFSYARLLRERHGYRGELRAAGTPALDQALFLHRCGFDSIEVPEGTSAEAWLAAQKSISVAYQPAADGHVPAYRLRSAARAGAAPADAETPAPADADTSGGGGRTKLAGGTAWRAAGEKRAPGALEAY